MNTNDALNILRDYLIQYKDDFIIHPQFIEDVIALLKNDLKGKESPFFDRLVTQLKNIIDYKRMVYKVDNNEILKGVGNDSNGNPYKIISIHIKGPQFNVRLLIHFNIQTKPQLLVAFFEKEGKKKSKNSYDPQIKTAKNRLSELS